ncbi:lauroyl/myristoyl acyltransferase [Thiohalobacter thiocyanaticus]|uniref:Lauroyl/myristoyl acyltransferase n=1 Tax=Thiohalobacter thiocyanaticus TaxID=585455 RepID=A0A1Z4VQA8_9GAMM|nr:lipid A biosynthesis acyltransferase [Thiohalobacter thiocyanaticus]BAZ93673.1 lauroyl/myristoyl acyltransferase [Thiohalobacter thiocyanaticus]
MPKYYLLPKRLAKKAPWTQQPVWLLEALVFYGLYGLIRLLPFPLAAAFLSRLFGVIGYHNTKKRRVVQRNLAVVLPQLTEAERDPFTRQVFRTTGLAAAELFLLDRLWRRRERYLEFDVHPEAMQAFERREAMVFATAHAGAWQLTNLISREYGLSISILYAREANPWLRRFFQARRRAFGSRLVPTAGGVRELMRELADGHSVGAAFDTRIDSGEMIPFFDVPAPTNTTPARLSLRGYPLIPIRCVRLPRHRYRIEVLAPLRPDPALADRHAQVSELTLRLNRLFEDWIRESPGDWLCMKRRWPKQSPAGESAA